MLHMQGTSAGWLDSVTNLPPKSSVKAVDRGDILKDARIRNGSVFTTLRHWNDNYSWTLGWETNKQMARDWFDSFVDGTFRSQYSPYVSAVSERNEYDSHTLPLEERAMRIVWMQAAAHVWATEYRKNELSHIRLILGDNAVGNDLPREAAVAAIDNDCLLGYHPYIAIYNNSGSLNENSFQVAGTGWTFGNVMPDGLVVGNPSPHEWEWASGRWNYMEQSWGLKPDWIFTEAGPIRDATGTGWLQPNDGWRHPGVCGGDVNLLIDVLGYWLDHMKQTSAYQEGRLYGWNFFTTGGGSQWANFEFKQPEMGIVSNWVTENWKPGTNNPPPPIGDSVVMDFEDGWTDDPVSPDRRQIPNGFALSTIPAGSQLWYANKVATGTIESVHKICGETIPPNQCADGDDPLILDGITSYKMQAVGMASGTSLRTTFYMDGEVDITVPINVHYQAPDIYNRVPPLESDDVYVALILNGQEVDKLQFPQLEDRKWISMYGRATGPVEAELRFQTSYANSRDLFTDSWEATVGPASWQEEMWEASVERQPISLNPDAAIQKVIFEDGYTPVESEEWEVFSDGVQRAYQAAEHIQLGSRRVYYANVPDWSNIQYITNPYGQAEGFRLTNWPTEYMLVTQMFGANPEDYERFGLPGHDGVDIRAPEGSAIFSAAPGIISKVHLMSRDGYHNYGNHIVMSHNGYETIYGHLSHISEFVDVGTYVNGGVKIGLSGNTGNSHGAHLHFGMKKPPGDSGWPFDLINPAGFLESLYPDVVNP